MLTRLLFVSALLFASMLGGSQASTVGSVVNGNFDETNPQLQVAGGAPYGWTSAGAVNVESTPGNFVSGPNSVKIGADVESSFSQPLTYSITNASDRLRLSFRVKTVGTSTPQIFRTTAAFGSSSKQLLITRSGDTDSNGFTLQTATLNVPANQLTGTVRIEFYSNSAIEFYVDDVAVTASTA